MAKKTPKPFLTYDEQLDNLITNKNLTINNPKLAKAKLHDVCYYSLIDGYKSLFYNRMTRTYEVGTEFMDIVALYDFDKKLRSLILQHICYIEQKLRSLISYAFCETHSVFQADYLTPSNYNYSTKNKMGIDKLISMLTHEAKQNTEHNYIVYQRNTYGNVPLWVMMQTLTFGQASKMYSFLTTQMQSKITTNYPNVSEKELGQYLKVLTHFRNICAHNERLFSFKSRFEIPNTKLHEKLKIQKTGNQYIQGKHDLFAIVISFRYLLNNDDFKSFKKELIKLINCFGKQTTASKKNKLLNAMGFPNNWKNIARYKI